MSRFFIAIFALLVSLFSIAANTLCEAQQAVSQEEPRTESETPDSRLEGVALVDFGPYRNCVELSNESTRVVLGHHRGGRILAYERAGKNVIWMANEKNWDPDSPWPARELTAGRFDVGPEQLQVRGKTLWAEEWKVEATGARRAKMTSGIDKDSGLQVVREFKLAADSSRMKVTQTVHNKGEKSVRQCFWSRTLAVHGGVAIVPCDSTISLMPNLYCMGPNGKTLLFRPEDKSIRRVDDFLVIDQPAEHAKLGFDSVKGWVAYQTRDDQLFVKRYPVYDIGKYGELAGYNLSIWYPKKETLSCCEIEPIGPMTTLEPGRQHSFSVEWWLLDRKFPKSGVVDPKKVEADVMANCKIENVQK